jgi:hypothetical protein
MIHNYKLRPYHNPEGVDESKVPKGWRFRFKDEMKWRPYSKCRKWICDGDWSCGTFYNGLHRRTTYIVPVTP